MPDACKLNDPTMANPLEGSRTTACAHSSSDGQEPSSGKPSGKMSLEWALCLGEHGTARRPLPEGRLCQHIWRLSQFQVGAAESCLERSEGEGRTGNERSPG